MVKRSQDLSQPAAPRSLDLHYDPEAFGRFSETIARYIGTARFLVVQTVVVIAWMTINAASRAFRFDEYPFLALTLALSLQAAYAAPLILLTQNRQEERAQAEYISDRQRLETMQATIDFLARKLVSIRLLSADTPSADDIQRVLVESLQSAGASGQGA